MDFSGIHELDVDKGLSFCADDMEIYSEVLESFLEITPEALDNLGAHLRSGDYTRYATEVHGLKSSLGNIGADELSDMARRLETAARKNNIEFLLDFTDIFEKDVSALCEKITEAMN